MSRMWPRGVAKGLGLDMIKQTTQRELVEKFRGGGRITASDSGFSMFEAEDEEKSKNCAHSWRCIVCWDSEADIDECRNCGRQVERSCNFDDDMS